MFNFIPCPGCGIGIDLDHVPSMPGKSCRACGHPLDAVAAAVVAHPSSDPAPRDGNDPVRLASVKQLTDDIARVADAHAQLKASAAKPVTTVP